MKATAILKVFFGGCMLLVGLRQIVVAMRGDFLSQGERGGYIIGTLACLGVAIWLVVSGLRSRRG